MLVLERKKGIFFNSELLDGSGLLLQVLLKKLLVLLNLVHVSLEHLVNEEFTVTNPAASSLCGLKSCRTFLTAEQEGLHDLVHAHRLRHVFHLFW